MKSNLEKNGIVSIKGSSIQTQKAKISISNNESLLTISTFSIQNYFPTEDFILAFVTERNIFQNKRNVEVFVDYPNTGRGIYRITFVEITVFSVSFFSLFTSLQSRRYHF